MKMTLPEFLDRVERWKQGLPKAEVVQFVEELFSRYLEACEDDRVPIRQAVQANVELWNVNGGDDICLYLNHLANDKANGIERHLRGWLIAVSLTGGCANWQDTINVLWRYRLHAEAQGIATRIHFDQIAPTADDGNCHGISEMSTRDLISAAGNPPIPEVSQPQEMSQPQRQWWRFWR